jgi:pyridoxine kinase
MNVLSIQSHVCYGHVGNSAAVFPLQRLGVEVWPINTVQFSNHTGYESFTGRTLAPETIREIVRGIEERGVLGECDGVLSGYLGSVEIGEAVLDAVAAVKRANPSARYCCDPVIGDTGRGEFVRPGVAEFHKRRAVPAADVVTPNQFELDYLSGRMTSTPGEVVAAMAMLRELGPRVVFVTSARTNETRDDGLDLFAGDEEATFRLRLPLLPFTPNGGGDAIAGLFFVHYLRTASVAEALSRAASSMFGVLSRTAEQGAREMLLIAAQQEFVEPSRTFESELLEPPVEEQA